VGKTETATYTTHPHREKVDLSLPPYSVVGDGVTDNTAILQKAINECRPDQYLFLPYGIYISEKLVINGNVKIQFGAGAVICDKETAKRL
jgi:polygalacturonase